MKPCKKMNELKEEERSHLRDVWIENRNQHGFQSERTAVRWPVHGEVTDRKDTWSDEFLVAVKAYFGALEVLKMTDEQNEENFERMTTWTTIAIDFKIATATNIPTARGQGQRNGGLQTQGTDHETSVEINDDDGRNGGKWRNS